MSSGRLPPSARRSLRQPSRSLSNAGTPGNPRVQPVNPHSELPPALPLAHFDRQVHGGTDPRVWLNDYHLACQLGGATTGEVIIRNLSLHLVDSAQMWLEHLMPSQIHNWDDLVRTFVGNFQGTYVCPGNS
jgi:hypothetical protein